MLRGATPKIVGDLTQEIGDKLEPLIPPQASPTTVGISPHQVHANHLVAGLTNTLGSLRRRPMPTPAAIPGSPFDDFCFALGGRRPGGPGEPE